MGDYTVPHEDLIEPLQRIDNMEEVEQIIEYQQSGIDYSVILHEDARIQAVRVQWLKHFREDLEWVSSTEARFSFILFNEKKQ